MLKVHLRALLLGWLYIHSLFTRVEERSARIKEQEVLGAECFFT
jgi:hypothetical protein